MTGKQIPGTMKREVRRVKTGKRAERAMAENNRTLAIGMGYHSNKLLPLPFRKVSAADLLACLNCYPVYTGAA